MFKASVTSLVVIRDPMLQPTIRRLNKSMNTARYSQPSRVQM